MNPFHPFHFPHIVTLLMEVSAYETLLCLRGVSRRYRDLVDAELTSYVSAELHSNMATGDGGIDHFFPSSPQAWGRWTRTCSEQFIPGLRIPPENATWSLTSNSTKDDLPPPTRRILALVKELYLHPAWQGCFAAVFLPHMTSLKRIRLRNTGLITRTNPGRVAVPTVEVQDSLILRAQPGTYPGADAHLALEEGVTNLSLKVGFHGGVHLTYSVSSTPAPPVRHPSTLRTLRLTMARSAWLDSDPTPLAHLLSAIIDPTHLAVYCKTVRYEFVLLEDELPQHPETTIKTIVEEFLTKSGMESGQVEHALRQNIYVSTTPPPEPTEGEGEDAWPRERLREQTLTIIPDPCAMRLVADLETALMAVPDPFSCRGLIPVDDENRYTLFSCDEQFAPRCFSVPLDDASAAQIYTLAKVSPDNDSDGACRQIDSLHFSLSPDPIGSLLPSISSTMKFGPLRGSRPRMDVYTAGGYAKRACCVPRENEEHVGSLVLCLSSRFAAGELVVHLQGEKSVQRWKHRAGAISWMFLRSDCETEVLPVTSGTRVTVFYDIFQPTYQSPRAPDQCYGGIPAALKAALDCPSLLPDGGVLAFGFQHKYPFAPPENSTIGNDIVHYLKGRDAEWMRAVDDAGLRSEVIAVYDTATTKYHREGDALVAYERRDFGASRNFHAIRGLYMDCSDDEAIVEFLAPGERVHWVTKPASWAIENTYAYYKCLETTRASVGLFVWLGPPGNRGDPGLVYTF